MKLKLPVDRRECESLPVTFGEPLRADSLFCEAEVPEGWSVVNSTEHYMYRYLLDKHGCKRAEIFFKPERYDRRADMKGLSRFYLSYPPDWRDRPAEARGEAVYDRIRDAIGADERVCFESGPIGQEAATQTCIAWLDEHWPEWRNVAAYW